MDTRELLEELENLQEQILENFNDRFETELSDYSELESVLEDEDTLHLNNDDREEFDVYWSDEFNSIREITEIRDDIEGYAEDNFEDGIHLILEGDFEEYCQELVEDCYDLRDVPQFIKDNINWVGVAEDLRIDYSEVEFRGDTYLYR